MNHDIAPVVKRLVSQGQMVFDKGEVSIWGVSMMLFPTNSIVILQRALESKLGKEGFDVMFQLGKMQAKEGSTIMYEKFGYPRTRKTADFSNQQSEIVSVGRPSYIRYDMKNKHMIIKNLNTPFAKQYSKLFGIQKDAVCHFIRGIYTGATETHVQSEVIGIETQCIAQGKPYCIFEVKPVEEWDRNNELVKKQFPSEVIPKKILEEKGSLLKMLKVEKK